MADPAQVPGVPFFDLSRQQEQLATEIQAAMDDVLGSQRFIMGPQVAAFEEAMASRFSLGMAVAVASGTDALLLPLKALEARPGDEVVVPAFTFFAGAGAVWNAGFKPVFCDVDAATFNATPALVRESMSERTRAVVATHLFGQMMPLEGLLDAADRHGVVVIEDAAQALGATQRVRGRERHAGSVGAAGVFSFFPTKNLGGLGDGGLVGASDPALGEKVALLRTHGGRKMYHHEHVGTNSRLDTLQAAVLLAKLPHLDRWLEARRAHAARYAALLDDVPEVVLPVELEDNRHSYNQFTVRAQRRDDLRAYLTERGIGTGLYYPAPLHLQPCFSALRYGPGSLPVAERLCAEVLSLPIFPELRPDEVEEVAGAIRAFYGAPSA